MGVLKGQHALFFTANNGREPLYIYLTAVGIRLFGHSVLAVRLAAAGIGTLTTLVTFLLARSWFNERVGALAAWLWATTFWAVHLSRVGYRAILMVPLLAGAIWLGSEAYRRQKNRWWLAAGLIYGLSFYAYLAARFSIGLLLLLALALAFSGRGRRLWPGAAFFALAFGIVIAPLLLLSLQDSTILLGRSGQVSILNPAINEGNLFGTLWRHGWAALGMFFWRGDDIWRHNLAGRPVFDPLMGAAMLLGVAWCWRHKARPIVWAILLWIVVMLGPTVLAEDTPHFLRAVGVLPVVLFLPALGLEAVWKWPRLPQNARAPLLGLMLTGSLAWTVADYARYTRQPETRYLFETAVRELAEEINQDSESGPVWVADQLWANRPALEFLVTPDNQVRLMDQQSPLAPHIPLTIYLWPYDPYDALIESLPPESVVEAHPGGLFRGDLEASAYPFYARLALEPRVAASEPLARFGESIWLHESIVSQEDNVVSVTLLWEGAEIDQDIVASVQLIQDGALIAQDDHLTGSAYLPSTAWQPGWLVRDRHTLILPETYDPQRQRLQVGIYLAGTTDQLPVFAPDGDLTGDSYPLQ